MLLLLEGRPKNQHTWIPRKVEQNSQTWESSSDIHTSPWLHQTGNQHGMFVTNSLDTAAVWL